MQLHRFDEMIIHLHKRSLHDYYLVVLISRHDPSPIASTRPTRKNPVRADFRAISARFSLRYHLYTPKSTNPMAPLDFENSVSDASLAGTWLGTVFTGIGLLAVLT